MAMINQGFDLHADRRPWDRWVGFFLFQWGGETHGRIIAQPGPTVNGEKRSTCGPYSWTGNLQFEEFPEGYAPQRPSFELSEQDTQRLFDNLWVLGFRPQQQINEASRIEAVTNHLQDMRAIVAKKLDVQLPYAGDSRTKET